MALVITTSFIIVPSEVCESYIRMLSRSINLFEKMYLYSPIVYNNHLLAILIDSGGCDICCFFEVAKFVDACRALPQNKKGFEFAGQNTHVIIALAPGSGDFDEQV